MQIGCTQITAHSVVFDFVRNQMSSVGDRLAARGETTRPDERAVSLVLLLILCVYLLRRLLDRQGGEPCRYPQHKA